MESLERIIGRIVAPDASFAPGAPMESSFILLATADAGGEPHLASAGSITAEPPDRVRVRYWFCPQSLANLDRNRSVAVVLWNARIDTGYQLIGKVEKVEQTMMMDGLAPEEETEPIPQAEQELLIRVHKVLAFRYAAHNDLEVEP